MTTGTFHKLITAVSLKIRDIFDTVAGQFLQWNTLVAKYGNVINNLQYHQIIASIPGVWKTILRQRTVGDLSPVGLEQIPSGVKLSKYYNWRELPYQKKNIDMSVKQLWEF